MGKNLLRKSALVLLGALVLGASASVAQAEEENGLIDATKTVTELQKQVDKLRANGRWAREGKLAAQAVCGDSASEQRFLPWGDDADYVLAPGGSVEDSAGWELKGAEVSTDNSPYSAGNRSLSLDEGATATSPVMCISTAHPTIRFFAANRADEDSVLEVEVLYEDLNGHPKKLKVARLTGGDSWQPTVVIPIHVQVRAAASEDGLTAIAVVLKARHAGKGGAWKVDDLCVDPLKLW